MSHSGNNVTSSRRIAFTSTAASTNLSTIPDDSAVAITTGNGNGTNSAWIWRENYSSSNWGIFHDNSTDYIHIVGNNTARLSVALGGTTIKANGYDIIHSGNIGIQHVSSATYVTSPLSGYNSETITDNTTSEDLTKAYRGSLFPVFHTTDWGWSDTLYWSGYDKWGGTELATLYNASSNVRVKIRKYTQSGNKWGEWTEFITTSNISSQSVNYASSSGNSDTVDSRHATGFMYWEGNPGKSNMNDIARSFYSSTGMTNLGSSSVDNSDMSGWTHFFSTSYADGGNGSNSWCFQLACPAGSSNLQFRSRSGGTVTNGTSWTVGWTKIIHAGNIGSQSVNYASSAGNADTVDGYHGDGLVKCYRGVDQAMTTSGYWCAMSTKTGIDNNWRHVLNMDWTGSDVNNWMSQLCIPTNGQRGVYYRSISGSSIANASWVKLMDADGTIPWSNVSGKETPEFNYVYTKGPLYVGCNGFSPSGNWNEGIRLYGTATDSTWSKIDFGCAVGTITGSHSTQWSIGRNTANQFVITHGTDSGNPVMTIGTDNATIFQTSVYSNSDRHLKKDISAIKKDSLEELFNISDKLLKQFTYKTTGKPSYGFIAQELKQYIPEAIVESTDHVKSVSYDIAYAKILASIVNEIKKLRGSKE